MQMRNIKCTTDFSSPNKLLNTFPCNNIIEKQLCLFHKRISRVCAWGEKNNINWKRLLKYDIYLRAKKSMQNTEITLEVYFHPTN